MMNLNPLLLYPKNNNVTLLDAWTKKGREYLYELRIHKEGVGYPRADVSWHCSAVTITKGW